MVATAQRAVGIFAVCVVVLALQFPVYDRGLVPFDEGYTVAVARRVADGEVLYRDVQTGIFPASYDLLAAMFRLGFDDLLSVRRVQVALNLALALLLWGVAGRVVRRDRAWMAPVLYAAFIVANFPCLTFFNYSTLSLVFAMTTLWTFLRYCEHPRRIDALACGASLACCVLAKQNFGLLAGLALAASTCLVPPAPARRLGFRAWVVVAASVTLSIRLVPILMVIGPSTFVHSTILDVYLWQVSSYTAALPPLFGFDPLDRLTYLFRYAPPPLFDLMARGWIGPSAVSVAARLAYGAAESIVLAAIVVAWKERNDTSTRASRTRCVLVFCGCMLGGFFPFPIFARLAQLSPFLILAALVVLDRVDHGLGREPAGHRLRLAVSLAGAAGLGAIVLLSWQIRSWHGVPLDGARAGVHVSAGVAEQYRDALAFLGDPVCRDRAVFAAPLLPYLYFLSGRRNPTPYGIWMPGPIDERRAIADLRRDPPSCVVLELRPYPGFPPFREQFPAVDRHLASGYRFERPVGAEWVGLVEREP